MAVVGGWVGGWTYLSTMVLHHRRPEGRSRLLLALVLPQFLDAVFHPDFGRPSIVGLTSFRVPHAGDCFGEGERKVCLCRWVGGWVGRWVGEWVSGWVGGWVGGLGGWVGGWVGWVG